jgi:hypothetical protein
MLKSQAGKRVELPQSQTSQYLEHQHCESVRGVYQTMQSSGLYKFTFAPVDSMWNQLNTVIYELDRLPEESFKEMIEVIARLSEARDELRLARFLFDVEEINRVYRLILRNKAVLRCKRILDKALHAWPTSGGKQLQDVLKRNQMSVEDV